jgi:hypothetical protein
MSIKRKLAGHCAVDSGQLILVDPCYVREDSPSKSLSMIELYEEICEVSIRDNFGPIMNDSAIVTSTGWGDGYYPVYVNFNDSTQRVESLEIKFIHDENESNQYLYDEDELDD